jgi:hypothetical protein
VQRQRFDIFSLIRIERQDNFGRFLAVERRDAETVFKLFVYIEPFVGGEASIDYFKFGHAV